MSLKIHNSPDHEFEPQYGLPEKLPKEEQVLWQGSPEIKAIVARVFHIKMIGVYFGVLLLYRLVSGVSEGEALSSIFLSALTILAISCLGLSLIALLGYLIASTAVYTITNKRVVMRIGIVLNMSFNFPLKKIHSADYGVQKDGSGDIYFTLSDGCKIALFHLWPHARPGKWALPQPSFRGIKNCAEVSQILTQAWASENNVITRSLQNTKEKTSLQAADKSAYTEVGVT